MSYRVTADEATGRKHWFEHFNNCSFSDLKAVFSDIFKSGVILSRVIRIPKKDFEAGIDKVNEMRPEVFCDKYGKLTVKGYSKKIFLDTLYAILYEADENSEYVILTYTVPENGKAVKVLPAPSKRYRHLGYYNDISDIMALSQKTASEIVNYHKSGFGAFHTDTVHEEDSDLIPEDEVEAITHNIVRFTPDGRYAVSDTSSPSWKLEHADCENEDSNAFIDIYELIE